MYNLLRENYLHFLKTFKKTIIFSGGIFFIGLLSGFFFSNVEMNEVQRLADGETSFFDYLLRNSTVSMMSVLGMITFGLSSVYILLINGLILGEAFKVTNQMLESPFQTLLLVLPHGVTEVMAIVISGAMGFFMINNAVLMLFQKRNKFITKLDLKAIIFGIGLVLVLVFVSAVIESTITPDVTDFL